MPQGLLAQRVDIGRRVVTAARHAGGTRRTTSPRQYEAGKAKRGMWRGTSVKPCVWRVASTSARPRGIRPSAPAGTRAVGDGSASFQLIGLGQVGTSGSVVPVGQMAKTRSGPAHRAPRQSRSGSPLDVSGLAWYGCGTTKGGRERWSLSYEAPRLSARAWSAWAAQGATPGGSARVDEVSAASA